MQVRHNPYAADEKETVRHRQELGNDMSFLDVRQVLQAVVCAARGMVWATAQAEFWNPLRCWSTLYLLNNISLNIVPD